MISGSLPQPCQRADASAGVSVRRRKRAVSMSIGRPAGLRAMGGFLQNRLPHGIAADLTAGIARNLVDDKPAFGHRLPAQPLPTPGAQLLRRYTRAKH